MFDAPTVLTRSTAARVWISLVGLLGVITAVDAMLRGQPLIAAAVCAGTACLVWFLLCLFVLPRITAAPDGLVIRNPLREVRIPWGCVREVGGQFFVEVTDTSGGVTRAWAAPLSAVRTHRARLRAKAADADLLASGLDPSKIPSHVARGPVETVRWAVEAAHRPATGHPRSGSEDAEGSASGVTSVPMWRPWIVAGVLAAATAVLAVLA